ncbi:MAG: DUF4924 family protein [Flavobacteriales bacterium]|nr:DUF4924 family protein [Flavobacteriales bacterium]
MTTFDPLRKRREENIAGYVIGMWQVEDLMRALELDMNLVEERLIAPGEGDAEAKEALRGWYAGLVERMKEQGLQRVGHLSEVEEVVNELEYLHRALVEVMDDEAYDALFAKAEPDIKAVQQHAGGDPEGPITSALTAVYGVMMLRSEGKPISKETQQADATIRAMLDLLSKHYRQMRRLPGVSLN